MCAVGVKYFLKIFGRPPEPVSVGGPEASSRSPSNPVAAKKRPFFGAGDIFYKDFGFNLLIFIILHKYHPNPNPKRKRI